MGCSQIYFLEKLQIRRTKFMAESIFSKMGILGVYGCLTFIFYQKYFL